MQPKNQNDSVSISNRYERYVQVKRHLRGEYRPQVFPFTGTNPKTLKEYTRGQSQGNRIYSTDGLSCTLASQAGGLGAKTGLYMLVKKNSNNLPSFIDLSTQDAKTTEHARALQARYAKGYSKRKGEVSGVAVLVLTPDRINKRQNGRRFKTDGEPSFTLTTQDRHGVYDGIAIRRLTPLECERLQAFPDNWTSKGINEKGEVVNISDTQRYKCCGNAITVNVVKEVISRLINPIEEFVPLVNEQQIIDFDV